jgi:hypothetical protein
MAKTISQRIALEGAEQIRDSLNQLGAAAAKSFGDVQKGVTGAAAPLDEFGRHLDKVGEKAYKFGSAIRDVSDNTVKFVTALGGVAKAAGVAGAALFGATKATADAGTASFEGAQTAGLSSEQFGRLTYAMKQSGVEATQAQQMFIKLNGAQEGTSEEAQKTRAAISSLGVSFTKLGDGSTDTERLLGDIAERFKQMPDGARKSALAAEIFGKRVGAKLIPFLNEGRAGIKRLSDEAEAMGVVFSGDAAKKSDDFGDALGKLQASIAGIRNAFTIPFLVPFTRGMNAAANAISKLRPEIARVGTAISTGLTKAFEVMAAVLTPIFTFIGYLLDQVAIGFNKIFGTDINGKTLLVVAGFVILAGVLLKVATALLGMFSFLGPVVKLLSGFPMILTAITTGIKLLSSTLLLAVRGFSLLITVLTGLNPITLIILAVVAAIALLYYYWPQISKAAMAAWKTISEGAKGAWETIKGYWNQAVKFFQDLFTAEFWAKLWDAAVKKAGEVWEAIKTLAINSLTALKDWIMGTWVGAVVRQLDRIYEAAKRAWEWASKAFKSSPASSGGPAPAVVAAARGGYISGPGTSTSDSIPARLSKGEFVQRAKAVKYYGTDFMRAINSLRIPKPQGFSVGGLVEGIGGSLAGIMPPRIGFAEGGMATVAAAGGGGRPVVLNIGGDSFPLTGGEDVVDRLTRRAGSASLVAAGRSPSWKRQ